MVQVVKFSNIQVSYCMAEENTFSKTFSFLQRFGDQPPGHSNMGRSSTEASASSQSHDSATPKRYQRELSPSGQQCTVLVTGVPTDASEELLTDYFENTRRSKGGPVSKVDINRERQTCLVTFESPDGRLTSLNACTGIDCFRMGINITAQERNYLN